MGGDRPRDRSVYPGGWCDLNRERLARRAAFAVIKRLCQGLTERDIRAIRQAFQATVPPDVAKVLGDDAAVWLVNFAAEYRSIVAEESSQPHQ